jgi:C-terminal processing protease CtpA/Prc
VGLILAPSRDRDGRFGVRGIAKKDGKDTVEDVQPGDKLLQVDGVDMQGLTMDSVIDSLRGKPGDIHILLLDRKGKQFTVKAPVRLLL